MLRFTFNFVSVLVLLILVCVNINSSYAVSVTPGKIVGDKQAQQTKLRKAKATYDLIHASRNVKKKLNRHLMPGHAYRWYDREHNWDRVHSLIDWAEGRPTLTYNQVKKRLSGYATKGDTLSLLQEGKMSPTDILTNWRLKKQLKIMEVEKAKKASKHFNNNVARVQYAIGRSKEESSDRKAASTANTLAGHLNVFKVAKSVASQIKTLSTALASKNTVENKVQSKSFLQISSEDTKTGGLNLLKKRNNLRFLESRESMKNRKASIGDRIKSGAKKGITKLKETGEKELNKLWTKAKCELALKAPFGLEKELAKKHCPNLKNKVSISQKNTKSKQPKQPPTKPTEPGATPANNAATDEMCVMCVYVMEKLERDIGFPGKDLSGTSEGYSSNSDVTYPGPASYDISDSGLGNSASNSLPAKSPLPGPGFSSGMFLETKEKVTNPVDPSQDFKDYETLLPNKQNLEERLKNDYNMEPRERALKASETTMLENERRALVKQGIEHVRFIDTSKAPKDEVGTGIPLQDAPRLTAYSLKNANMAQGVERGSFLETDEVGGLPSLGSALYNAAGAAVNVAGAMAKGAMSNLHCPEGMPYCRKPLKRLGRRGLEREQERNNKQLQFANTYFEMGNACKSMLKEFPAKYTRYVQNVQQNLPQVAKEYLHDYSNEEICVDIGMCIQKQVRVQATKIDYRL